MACLAVLLSTCDAYQGEGMPMFTGLSSALEAYAQGDVVIHSKQHSLLDL